MTNLEILLIIVFVVIPALVSWVGLFLYVVDKVFNDIERDRQIINDYTFDCYGHPYKIDELNDYSFYDEYGRATDKDEREEYLKLNSDYRDAKFKYVEDKMNDYLNSNEATLEFQYVFGSVDSHENKKARWEARLNDLRKLYEKDFNNL